MKKIISAILSVLLLITVCLPAGAVTDENESDFRGMVVGYFPSYRYYSAGELVDFSAMTHTILSFIRYNDGLICDFSDSQIRDIKSKCDKCGTKLMISLGGWNGFNYTNNPIDTAEERAKLIGDLMYYVDTYDLDGIDIDIEITNEDFWQYFDSFASGLSARLKAEDKLLTMAPATWFTDPIQKSTYDYFDFLNLMCYETNRIVNYVNYYSARGVSKDRMTIGVPFFGSDDSPYSQIILSDKKTISQQSSYNGITFDGMPAIAAKAEYSLEFGGIMIWEVGQDSFDEYSLLQVIKNIYKPEKSDVAPASSLTAKNTTLTGTTLCWEASPDAVKYDIYISSAFSNSEFLGSTTDLAYPVKNLESGSVYTFKVYAVDKDGKTSWSSNVNVEMPIDAEGIADWDSSTIYLKGDKAVYNGSVYMAQWWTRGNIPGSADVGASVWAYTGKAGSTKENPDVFVFKINDENIYYANLDVKFSSGKPAVIVDGRAVVPLRAISSAVGVTDLKYDEGTKEITFTGYDGYKVKMTVGSEKCTLTKGSEIINMTITPPVIRDSVTMLPLRDTANLVGGYVEYSDHYIVVSKEAVADEDIPSHIAAYDAK